MLAMAVVAAACAQDPVHATDGSAVVPSAGPADASADLPELAADAGAGGADAGINCASSCDFSGGVPVGCATRFQYGINFAWDQFAGHALALQRLGARARHHGQAGGDG